MKPDIRVFPDLTSLSKSVASEIDVMITRSAKAGGKFTLALAGGNTPRTLYHVMAEDYGSKITWGNVHLFWGDERYVPPNHPQSNYRMVREMLIDQTSIPIENVHPMPTNYPDPEEAAQAYEKDLRNYFRSEWPYFSLMILGIGPDGHTASLFPNSRTLEEKQRWVVTSTSTSEPKKRLTLTLPALSNAEQIFFLVSGLEKTETFRNALSPTVNKINCPATKSVVTCWVDQDAAHLL